MDIETELLVRNAYSVGVLDTVSNKSIRFVAFGAGYKNAVAITGISKPSATTALSEVLEKHASTESNTFQRFDEYAANISMLIMNGNKRDMKLTNCGKLEMNLQEVLLRQKNRETRKL